MKFTNLDLLNVYQNEDNSRELIFEIDEALNDCDIYIDFEKPDGTKSKVHLISTSYLIPKALLNNEGYIKCQLVAYRGLTFVEKSAVYKFYVANSINATEYIETTQPDVIEELQTTKADDLVYESSVLQLMANGERIGTAITIEAGTEINVQDFQEALENISGHRIDHDCTTVNEVLRAIDVFYEFAKIIVNAVDSVTLEPLTDITVTVLSASDYLREDGYYYIPASDTEWTMRVTKSGYTMRSTTFVITTEIAQAGELIINLEMVLR